MPDSDFRQLENELSDTGPVLESKQTKQSVKPLGIEEAMLRNIMLPILGKTTSSLRGKHFVRRCS